MTGTGARAPAMVTSSSDDRSAPANPSSAAICSNRTGTPAMIWIFASARRRSVRAGSKPRS
jgi:hypothetical protein